MKNIFRILCIFLIIGGFCGQIANTASAQDFNVSGAMPIAETLDRRIYLEINEEYKTVDELDINILNEWYKSYWDNSTYKINQKLWNYRVNSNAERQFYERYLDYKAQLNIGNSWDIQLEKEVENDVNNDVCYLIREECNNFDLIMAKVFQTAKDLYWSGTGNRIRFQMNNENFQYLSSTYQIDDDTVFKTGNYETVEKQWYKYSVNGKLIFFPNTDGLVKGKIKDSLTNEIVHLFDYNFLTNYSDLYYELDLNGLYDIYLDEGNLIVQGGIKDTFMTNFQIVAIAGDFAAADIQTINGESWTYNTLETDGDLYFNAYGSTHYYMQHNLVEMYNFQNAWNGVLGDLKIFFQNKLIGYNLLYTDYSQISEENKIFPVENLWYSEEQLGLIDTDNLYAIYLSYLAYFNYTEIPENQTEVTPFNVPFSDTVVRMNMSLYTGNYNYDLSGIVTDIHDWELIENYTNCVFVPLETNIILTKGYNETLRQNFSVIDLNNYTIKTIVVSKDARVNAWIWEYGIHVWNITENDIDLLIHNYKTDDVGTFVAANFPYIPPEFPLTPEETSYLIIGVVAAIVLLLFVFIGGRR